MNYYDRNGEPITMDEWVNLFTPDYKRVAETTLPNGVYVSTVWLGLNHRYTDDGPPLIFETMAFENSDFGRDLRQDRYATEEEALKGHEEMVEWAFKWSPDEDA